MKETIRALIDRLVPEGDGIQVAAYLDGELILDEVAGPVSHSTPIFSWSTGKGLTATIVHILVEQGRLAYDMRIADVWEEFAEHGKEQVTLRHALTHSAGIPQLPADIMPDDFTDWGRMCDYVAGTELLWEPGTRHGYHAWTWGWLIGETVRRETGLTMSQAIGLISGPLWIKDELFFGIPRDQVVAPLTDGGWDAALQQVSALVPKFDLVSPPRVRPGAAFANRPDILGADIPATGTVTARAMAKMYAALIGEVGGVRLISPERLREVIAVAVSGPDWVFGADARRSLGYTVEDGYFGWDGMGGSVACAYPDLGLALAVTKTRMGTGQDDPADAIRAEIVRLSTDRARATRG